MGQALGPAWTTCARCGLPLKQRRAVCTSCGAVSPVERLFVRLKSIVQPRLRALRRSVSRGDFTIWCLACVPLLVAPPLVAIVLALRTRHKADRFLVVLIALLNIAISIQILLHLRADILALFQHWLPGGGASPGRGVTLTPI